MPLKEEIKEEAKLLEQEVEKVLEKLHIHRPIPLGKVLIGIFGLILIVWLLLWLTAPKECIPGPEVCDGIDNDCDGVVDNDLTQECGVSEEGVCTMGITTCQNGRWSPCAGAVGPVQEVCDNLDNNCDGAVDNIAPTECYYGLPETQGVGMCKAGFVGCANGTISGCVGMIMPAFEDCDNRDNDCDGQVDEDVTRPCYSGPTETRNVGKCKSGLQHCENSIYGACTGEVLPSAEICDSKDNDCDGLVDEGCNNQSATNST